MAIEAPYSKYRRQNCLIFIIAFIVLSTWCVYDGYLNDEWIAEHTNEDGTPQPYLTVNRQAPYVFVPLVILIGTFWYSVRDKKIVAEENELIISEKEKIPYDSIQKIDKTNYDSKGFFVITYKTGQGSEVDKKISYKSYDNLKPVLEHLVAKIS